MCFLPTNSLIYAETVCGYWGELGEASLSDGGVEAGGVLIIYQSNPEQQAVDTVECAKGTCQAQAMRNEWTLVNN